MSMFDLTQTVFGEIDFFEGHYIQLDCGTWEMHICEYLAKFWQKLVTLKFFLIFGKKQNYHELYQDEVNDTMFLLQ